MVSPHPRPRRSLLAALACFALAGLANAPLAGTPRAVLALAATAAGVYAAARFARSVERLRLVYTALSLWVAVLAVAAVAAASGSGPYSSAATWSVLLGAGSTTAFLGFREYGSQVGADAPDERGIDY